MNKFFTRWLLALIVVGLASPLLVANASSITYHFKLSTTSGEPVTNIVLYAANDVGDFDIHLSPVVLPGSGIFQLTHTVNFVPTSALVLGISDQLRVDKQRWDVILFSNNAFFADALGGFWRDSFPSDVDPLNRRLRHNEFFALLQAVHITNAPALDILTSERRLVLCPPCIKDDDTVGFADVNSLELLTTFLRGSDTAAAYFDPYGSFKINGYSMDQDNGGIIPEPSTMLLLGSGLAGLGFFRWRRKREA